MSSRNKREGVYAGFAWGHRRGHTKGYHAPSSANAGSLYDPSDEEVQRLTGWIIERLNKIDSTWHHAPDANPDNN